ncbi:MAG: GNAT family N-acetyltransferase, partial [Nitriliruptoraceae bacterium]
MYLAPGPDHDALRAEARRTAASHADRLGVSVVELREPAEARAVADLIQDAYRPTLAGARPLEPDTLLALAHSGCPMLVARGTTGGDVVAAAAGWLGRDPATGEGSLHVHVLAGRAREQGRGLGRTLAWALRAWAVERGIATVRWTIDPLVRRDAVLSLAVLGAGTAGYEVDLYGPTHGPGQPALPTDRLVLVWDVGAPRVRSAAAGRAATPDVAALQAAGAEVALDIGQDGEPLPRTTRAPRRLVR